MIIDFIGKRYLYLILSGLFILPGIISLLIPPSLRPGIEFTSGTLMTFRFEQPVEQAALRDQLALLGHGDAIIQRTGEGDYLVRTRLLQSEAPDQGGNITSQQERQRLLDGLQERFGPVTMLSFDAVSPLVAREIGQKAMLAVVVASVFILLYITYAFRQVPSPLRYGTCAIVAMLHDVLMVVGLFSIFGKVFNIEVDSMFITAVLTVIGFSVHDTIVVFDRIRENIRRMPGREFGAVVNDSLMQTVARSLNTSLTLVFTAVALLLFGGVTIRNFLLAMLIGTVSGTYSSIFIASQLLVMWEYGELSPGKLFRRVSQRQEATVR